MSAQSLKLVNFGASKGGLTTVGYTVYDSNRTLSKARTTDGVGEVGTNTGIYSAKISMPDDDAIILWDTGEATPRYATEDYQSQLGIINDQTDRILKIWNTLKNYEPVFAKFNERLGMIEKNEALKKVGQLVDDLTQRENLSTSAIQKAFEKVSKEITIDLKAQEGLYSPVVALVDEKINALKAEIDRVPKEQRDYSTYFINLSKHLANVSDYMANIRLSMTKFDNISVALSDISKKVNSLSANSDKDIKSKNDIIAEVQRLTQFIHLLSSSPMIKNAQEANSLMMAFGHMGGK